MEQDNLKIQNIPINMIVPNQFQPRLNFDEKALDDLASSIKEHGIIQPLVLRKVNNKYEIIAGERRFRAACLAGLESVPAILKEMDDNTSAEVALIENVQRKNLTPIEEAKSYKNILDKGVLTQDELANKLGLSQSAVSNKLRLLNLSDEVQDALLSGKISERHARSLLILNKEEQTNWLNKIISERLTVRQLDLELKSKIEKEDNIIKEEDNNIETINKNFSGVFTPNINEIVSNAKDIIPKEEPKPTINLLKPSETQLLEENKQKEFELPKVIPNKFFNYLEDDEANMNTEPLQSNIIQETNELTIKDNKIQEQKQEEKEINLNSIHDNNQINSSITNNRDISFFNEKEAETQEIDNTIYEQNFQGNSSSQLIDPLDLIETLSPDYEINKQEEEGLDLKTAINSVRTNINSLNYKGFNIELEELDLPESYEINIKIKK